MSCIPQTEKDLFHKTPQKRAKFAKKKKQHFRSVRCSRFRSAHTPLSDFGERLLELFAAVLCTKTCSLLVQKSSLLRCLTVSFRRNPTHLENAENRIVPVRARLVCSYRQPRRRHFQERRFWNMPRRGAQPTTGEFFSGRI